MRWQQKTLTLCVAAPSVALALALTGCGSSGRTTTVVQTWDERPRFFTAEPGEEHSRFANVVWYDRPRFFTKAEGEERSRFGRLIHERPRPFTSRTEYVDGPTYTTSYPSATYGTTTYDTNYRTIPVESRETIIHDGHHKDCDCPHRKHLKTEKSTYQSTTVNTVPKNEYVPAPSGREYATDAGNSYGAATHRNVTQPPSITEQRTRVELTSDMGNRSFGALISNWPQESKSAALAMQAKYGPPDSSTNDQLTWLDQDPWAEIVVSRNGTPHVFPTQHMDVLAQSIYFNVDADRVDELHNFRGNIKVDHARGLLTANCRDEAMNFLALNLAHEILSGEKSAVESNRLLDEKARGEDKSDDYMQDLQFDVGTDMDDNEAVNTDNVDREINADYPDTDQD